MQQQYVVPKLFRSFEDEVGVVFGLDEGFKIRYCNPAWDRFAVENGGSERLLRKSQLGRPLFHSIPQVLRKCYEGAFHNVLDTGTEWQQCYDCSSPHTYRLHHMRVVLTDDPQGLLVINSLVVSRPYDGIGTGQEFEEYKGGAGMIIMCANCRRVRRKDRIQWDWVPQLVASMPEQVSHDLCSPCWAVYYSKYRPS